MKKALMGTTALVAAATMTTGVAVADEMAEEDGMMEAQPISLSIGGRSMWGVAIVDNEAATDKDDIAIANDTLLVFSGSTVLDSGLEVAIRIDVDGGQDNPAQGKFAAVSGSFGELRVGNQDTASYKMSTAAPYATYFYGINTPFWTAGINGSNSLSTFAGAGAGGASLMYFSPVINGFQFGASYTPEAGEDVYKGASLSQEGHDAWSIGTRYDGAFGDTGITFAAGMTQKDVPMMAAMAAPRGSQTTIADNGAITTAATADCPDGANLVDNTGAAQDAATAGGFCLTPAAMGRTVSDWNAGLVVSMSGVSIGGSYRNTDHDNAMDDTTQYDVGIMYGEGPWAVSANFGNKSQDSEGVDTDLARLMATYNLGPGINMAGVLGQDSPDGDNADTTFGAMALLISF